MSELTKCRCGKMVDPTDSSTSHMCLIVKNLSKDYEEKDGPVVFDKLPTSEHICKLVKIEKLQLTNSYLKAKDAGEIA